MRLVVKLLVVLCVSSLAVFADGIFSVTYTGLQNSPSPGRGNSFPISSSDNQCSGLSGCIITGGGQSNAIAFEPVSVTITENSAGNWTYTEQTYTPNQLNESGSVFGPTAFGDALFYDTATNTYWGLALDTNLDGLSTAGGLYYAGTNPSDAFLTPGEVVPPATGGSDPVLINKNNDPGVLPQLASSGNTYNVITNACYDSSGDLLFGSTSTSSNVTSSCAPDISSSGNTGGYSLYTITDTFTVAPGFSFLGDPDPFDFEVASYVCSNGVILGSSSGVPEPRGLVFIGAALLLLAGRFARSRAKAAA